MSANAYFLNLFSNDTIYEVSIQNCVEKPYEYYLIRSLLKLLIENVDWETEIPPLREPPHSPSFRKAIIEPEIKSLEQKIQKLKMLLAKEESSHQKSKLKNNRYNE